MVAPLAVVYIVCHTKHRHPLCYTSLMRYNNKSPPAVLFFCQENCKRAWEGARADPRLWRKRTPSSSALTKQLRHFLISRPLSVCSARKSTHRIGGTHEIDPRHWRRGKFSQTFRYECASVQTVSRSVSSSIIISTVNGGMVHLEEPEQKKQQNDKKLSKK